jgi:hypothetical protein
MTGPTREQIRHAAALALVGWYLMLPPLGPSEKNFPVASEAPLVQWTNSGSFDTAKECEIERHKLSVDADKRAAEAARAPTDTTQALALGVVGAERLATCIETTDPRLKEIEPKKGTDAPKSQI